MARDDPVGGRERQERGAERGSEGGRGGRAVEWLEDEPELVGLGGARAEEHGGIAPCEQIDLQAVGGHLDRLGVLLPEVARDDRQRRVVADRAHPAIAVAPGTLAVEVGGLGVGLHELVMVRAKWVERPRGAVDAERGAGERAREGQRE